MPLNMPSGYSRFRKQPDHPMPDAGVEAFRQMINLIASQGSPRSVYETFKACFARVAGHDYYPSSDESWAASDLASHMSDAAASAPLFLSALYDGIEALKHGGQYDLPSVDDINSVCREVQAGFEIHPPDIVPTNLVAVHHFVQASDMLTKVVQEKTRLEKINKRFHRFPESFDVAISFARPERELARSLAEQLHQGGLVVFYDEFYAEHLWGKNLTDVLDSIYRHQSRFCVMFVSKAYADREWTNHERQSALARALKERGSSYVLPIRVDDTDLPGLPDTIAFFSLREMTLEEIAIRLIKRVRQAKRRSAVDGTPTV